MKSIHIKKLFTLHSWVGLISGILLFVICFTGAVSVFGHPELRVWGNPDVRNIAKVEAADVERLVNEYAEKVPPVYQEEIIIFPASERGFKNLAILFESHSGIVDEASGENSGPMGILYQFNPSTLELISKQSGELGDLFENQPGDMADFIVHFHADLHLGEPLGLLITGLLGLTLMISIITGLVIHRKILSQLFTFRLSKSFSLALNDGHKVMGVWGVAFHTTIAFTGAFLGLALVILVPAAAYVSFEGDQQKLLDTFTTMPEPVIENIYKPTPIALVMEAVPSVNEEVRLNSLIIKGLNDNGATLYANIAGGEQVATLIAAYDANGEQTNVYSTFGRLDGFSGKILDIMFPLHFGNFGGLFVKLIWGLLGIGTALLPITGLMLWIERGLNTQNSKHSQATYTIFNRLFVGACAGSVLATCALLPTQILVYQLDSFDTSPYMGPVFFSIWSISIVVGLIVKNTSKLALFLAQATSICLISALPLNTIFNGFSFIANPNYNELLSTGMDWVFLILGVLLFYKATGLYQQSKLRLHQKNNDQLLESSTLEAMK